MHNCLNFPGKVLQATDRRKVTFLDVLIECDQKMVVSNAAVSVIIIVTTTDNNDSTNHKPNQHRFTLHHTIFKKRQLGDF